MNRIYAASPTWGTHVSYFLADMEKFQKEYEGNLALEISNLVPQTAGSSAMRVPLKPDSTLTLALIDK